MSSKYDGHEVDDRPRRNHNTARFTVTKDNAPLKKAIVPDRPRRGDSVIANDRPHVIKEIFWHSKNHGEIIVA